MALQWSCSGRRVRAALRRVMSFILRDLAIVGASCYGNADLLNALRNTGCGAADRAPGSLAVAREAAVGIAEIEDYLAARSPGRSATPPRPATRPRPSSRRRPG